MNRDEARGLIQKQFEDGPLPSETRAQLFAAIREDPELKTLYDRYAEMEVGLEDGGLGAMKARLQAHAQAALTPEVMPGSGPVDQAKFAPVIDLEARRRARRRWVGAGLAAAAAVMLLSLIGRGPGPEVPGYTLELSAGAQMMRGPEQVSLRFEPTTRFTIVLHPQHSAEGQLEARAALVADQTFSAKGKWLSKDGAFKLEGRTDQLFDAPPGEYELVVAVGPQGELPKNIEGVTASETLRIWRRTVVLVAPAHAP